VDTVRIVSVGTESVGIAWCNTCNVHVKFIIRELTVVVLICYLYHLCTEGGIVVSGVCLCVCLFVCLSVCLSVNTMTPELLGISSS